MKDNIFITKEQVNEMKKSNDVYLQKLITQAINIADEGLETEALTEDKVRYNGDENHYQNQHEYYYNATRPFAKYMPYFGFAYYYTDDKKYFDKARELMLMYAGYERWHGRGYFGRGELVTCEFCTGMRWGYEFFKECFEESERKYIAERVYNLGILTLLEDWIMPGKKINALDTMGHNWWSSCVFNGGLTALIFREDIPEGAELARFSLVALQEWLTYKGNPIDAKPVNIDNGGYYESVSYYTISECVAFENLYRKIVEEPPFDNTEIYKLAADFYINTFYPSKENIFCVPFGDCGCHSLMTGVYYMIAAGIKAPELRWYVQQCKRHDNADFVFEELLYYEEIYGGEIRKPKAKNVVYENIGWAIFRDGFEDDSNMLAVKCGDTWNHAHADAGSFVFYRKGHPDIDEAGRVYYGTGAYHGYIVTSKAHNVVLYNGEGQHYLDIHKHARLKGKLYNFVNQDGFNYVAADPTGPMGRFFRRHLRHFLWLDDFVLIYDDITAYEPGELSFLLHSDDNTAFKMLTPCKAERKVIYTNDAVNEDEKITFGKIKDVMTAECMIYSINTDDECRGKFVGVIPVDENLVPEFEEIENGYKIKCGDTIVYINLLSDGRIMHQNCINVMDGITTDAVILVDKNGKYGVVNGSIVRKDRVSYHDTLYRTNGWV